MLAHDPQQLTQMGRHLDVRPCEVRAAQQLERFVAVAEPVSDPAQAVGDEGVMRRQAGSALYQAQRALRNGRGFS